MVVVVVVVMCGWQEYLFEEETFYRDLYVVNPVPAHRDLNDL